MRGIFLIVMKHWYNVDMEQDYNKKHWTNPCPKYDCRKEACKCGLKFVSIPAALGDDSDNSDVAPKNGLYCNTIVRYEANDKVYIYSKEGIPVKVEKGDYGLAGSKMAVTLSLATGSEEYGYTWDSSYTYDELSKNPENIKFFLPQGQWLCAGSLQNMAPIYTEVTEQGISWKTEVEGFAYTVFIHKPSLQNDAITQAAYFSSNIADNYSTRVIILPELELEPYATEIPENTTFAIPFDKDIALFSSNTYDCDPVQTRYVGNFIILPVKRRIGDSLSNVTEQCLITNATRRPSSGVPDSYWFKTFEFNGEKYKMSFSSMSGDDHIYVINKIVN